MTSQHFLALTVAIGLTGGCVSDNATFEEFGEDQDAGGKADQASDGLPRLDVNDVSILYPLPATAAALSGLLGLDTKMASGAPLLTKDQFTQLVALIHPADDPTLVGLDYADWHVIAVRVDPCEKATPSGACVPQLRLVAQSFDKSKQSGAPSPDDNTIHLAFSLPADQLVPLLRDLVHLKTASATINTNGKPLGVHPILKSQGLTGAFATGLKALVTTYAAKAAQVNVSTMFTLHAGEWRFAGGVIASGKVQAVAMPCSPNPTISMTGTTGVLGNFMNGVAPAATCADNVNEIIDSNAKDTPFKAGSFFRRPADQQTHDIDLALRVLNPKLNRIGTTDCVSCHTASRALARVKDSAFLNLDDGNPNRFVPPKGMTTKYATSTLDAIGPYNVRAFGYQDREIAYAQVTVNLSALAADAINQKIRTDHILTP